MCIRKWEVSYREGDLFNPALLREAMAYRNFLDSPADVQTTALQMLQGEACEKVLLDGKQPDENRCFLGQPADLTGSTLYFFYGKELFLNPAGKAAIPAEFLDLTQLMRDLRRNILFISTWEDEAGERGLQLPNEEGFDCRKTAMALGLCGKSWISGDTVTILALSVKQAHKPTWLDSWLTFFWYAAPNHDTFGLTRSLINGRPHLREWVLRKIHPDSPENYQALSYWKPKMEQDCDLRVDQLGNDFWSPCAKEMRP